MWKSFYVRRTYRIPRASLARGPAQVEAMIGIHRGADGQIVAQTLQNRAAPAVKELGRGSMSKP